MKEAPIFRKLDVPINRPHKLTAFFWWSAGILLALLFIAVTAMCYHQYKLQHP